MGVNYEAEKRAYQMFIDSGMSVYGACGLIGNLEAESDGFFSNRVEYLCLKRLKENGIKDQSGNDYTDETYTAAVDAGRISCETFLNPLPGKQYGYGLAQWTSPGRKAGLWNMAKEMGVSIADEKMQLTYLLKELNESYYKVMVTLKTATSIREASDMVLKKYEIPADTSEKVCASRAARGQLFFEKFVNNILMYLQILVVVLLMIALMAPFINIEGKSGGRKILLIDTSASMQHKNASGKTRLEEAVEQACD